MKHLRIYSIYLLLGVFLFPLVFQSAHVVHHHAQELRAACCHVHETAADPVKQDGVSQAGEAPCAICNYTFSLNVLPGLNPIKTCLPYVSGALPLPSYQRTFAAVYTVKTPRAPPV